MDLGEDRQVGSEEEVEEKLLGLAVSAVIRAVGADEGLTSGCVASPCLLNSGTGFPEVSRTSLAA